MPPLGEDVNIIPHPPRRFQVRNAIGQMARMAGLEPATAALTVRGSTIELHPNGGGGSRIRTDVMQLMRLLLVTTPVNPAFSQINTPVKTHRSRKRYVNNHTSTMDSIRTMSLLGLHSSIATAHAWRRFGIFQSRSSSRRPDSPPCPQT